MKIADSAGDVGHAGSLHAASRLKAPPEGRPQESAWQARLSLGFEDDRGVTRLVRRTHTGPLLVQKPLYPEGSSLCHAVIIHPPGGVVGGDELAIDARLGPGAQAFVTTPGAAKWYKSNGRVSSQRVGLEVADGGRLEWLPQETIFFDAARVDLDTEISIGRDARFIGSEILCFGRTASGERFAKGRISQRISILQAGKLVWFEQGMLDAESALMRSPLGLNGRTVCATLIAAGAALPSASVGALREAVSGVAGQSDACGVTQLKTVTVVRCLSDSSENARRLLVRAWEVIRPVLMDRTAVVPRIWNT